MKKHIVCFGDSNTHGYCANPMDCADGGIRFNESERSWASSVADRTDSRASRPILYWVNSQISSSHKVVHQY